MKHPNTLIFLKSYKLIIVFSHVYTILYFQIGYKNQQIYESDVKISKSVRGNLASKNKSTNQEKNNNTKASLELTR